MTINVCINGASGRMGQQTVAAISGDSRFHLIAQCDRMRTLSDALAQQSIDVVIDFTCAEDALINARTIINANCRPVIGTSGLLDADVAELKQLCDTRQLGGIIAANFSIGAVLMMQLAERAAAHFKDVEIIEYHHDGKQDSPSGTALKTADMLARTRDDLQARPSQRENIPHARGATYHNIPIHAVRLPGVVANQSVVFGGPGETFTISHQTINRECFMPGVLLASEAVMQLNHLVIGLEHILNM